MQRGSYSTHSISVFCIVTDYEWWKWWWVKKKDGIGACYPFSHHHPFMYSANFKSQRVESSKLPVIASLFSIPGTGQVEKSTFCFGFRRIITVKDFKSKVLMQIHKLHSTSLFLLVFPSQFPDVLSWDTAGPAYYTFSFHLLIKTASGQFYNSA